MKYLLHTDDEEVSIKLNHDLYILPPNKAVRVDNDYHADRILEHKAYHGVVEVQQIADDDGGFKLDVKGAKEAARIALDAQDENVIGDYMKTQLEDRIRLNYPALPPQGRALKVIRRRHVDLLAQGIKPVGYEVERQQAMEKEAVANLKDENAALRKQMDDLAATVRELQAGNAA